MRKKVKISVLASLILLSALITLIPTGVFSTSSAPDPPSCGAVQESGHIISTFPSYTSDQGSDSYGDTVLIQICGFALDPVAAGNPPNNYYLLDIQANATAGKNRSVDTSGLGDSNGPTLVVTSLLMCSNCTVNATEVWPRGTMNLPGGVPTTASVGASYNGVSAGVSWTWPPPSSQANLVNETQTRVQWTAGDNSGGDVSTFTWTFQEVVIVPNNETPQFYIVAKGNFWLPGNCGFAACNTAYASVVSQHDYSISPVTSSSTTVTNSTSTIASAISTITRTTTQISTMTSVITSPAQTSTVISTVVASQQSNNSGPLDQTSAIVVAVGMVLVSSLIALRIRRR